MENIMDDFEKVFPGEPLNDETPVDYYERTPAALLSVYEMIIGKQNGDD